MLRIYNALAQSDYWTKTLFVIFYDEHGGFYDHVTPPGTPGEHWAGEPPADDRPELRRYGVRVPALVVSPFAVERHVAKETYDHTSVMATIFRTFCPDEADRILAEEAEEHGATAARTLLLSRFAQAPVYPPRRVASCRATVPQSRLRRGRVRVSSGFRCTPDPGR